MNRQPHVPRPHRLIAAALVLTAATFLFALSVVAAASAADQRSWVRHYPGSSGSDSWDYIAKGPSGTIYVAGWRNAEMPNERAMVAKYTASGKRVWLRTFAGVTGDTVATGLAVDSRGRAFLIAHEQYGGGTTHIALVKLASRDGRRVWVKRYNGPGATGSDLARDVAVGAKGAVYVTGGTETAASGYDALLVKFVDKGARAARSWVRTYRNPSAPPLKNADIGQRVVVDSRGRVFWAGSSDQGTGHPTAFVRRVRVKNGGAVWTDRVANDVNVNLSLVDLEAFPTGGVVSASVRGPSGPSGTDAVVTRYTYRGGKRFKVTLAGADHEVVNDLAVDRSGNIAVAGYVLGTAGTSAWVVRGNALFTGRWERTFDSPMAGEAAVFEAVTMSPGGAVYCGGRSNTGFITGYDFTMVKYSAGGDRRWVDVYDDQYAPSKAEWCHAVLYVGGSKPGLYGAGLGGAPSSGEALLIKYRR